MAFKPLSALRRGFVFLWTALDVTRRTFFNLLFLLIVILVIAMFFGGGVKPLSDKTALVVEVRGDLVEQYETTLRDTVLDNVGGDSKRTVRLRDVIQVMDNAGRGLERPVRPEALPGGLARQRGVRAPDGHGHDRGLWRAPQLLPRRARQGRRDGQPGQGRHL